MIRPFLPNFIQKMIYNPPKPLGRWKIDKCNTSVYMTNYHSNIDHCGTCSYEKNIIQSMIKDKANMKNKDKI